MRGPTAGTALFALALLTAHSPDGRVNRLPWSAGTKDGACSGLATALELDPLLAAYEGGPPTTHAAGPVAGPHQHARDLWSLHVVWDELGRFFARFDPFGHKKHREPCDDDDADKDKHQTHAHDVESGYGHAHSYGYDEHEHEQDHAWGTRGSRGSEGASADYAIEDSTPMRANATTDVTPAASISNGTTTEQRNETTPVIDDALLRGRRRRHRQLAEPTAEADPTTIEIGTTMEPNRRRLFSFYVVMNEVGRFFARFDPFGHKNHRHPHPEPSHDDNNDGKDDSKRLPTLYIPVPLWIIKPVSTNPPPPPPPSVGASTVLRANDTLVVNATAMASNMTADSTTSINTTAAVPTVDEAQLQGRRRRRHLLRGSDDGGKDDDAGAMPMMSTGEDDSHHEPSGLGQRLARTEEVEMLRHEQLWALPSEKQKAAKPKVVGEAYERISSQSVIFLGPNADADAGGKAMGDSDGEAAVATVAAEEDHAIDHERGRQLLLHHWHGHGGRADDFDDDDFDDYDDEYESEAQPNYYSKDGGDWYWQTHGFRRLQEAGEGMDMDGDDAGSGAPGALMIDADDPETSVPSKRRPSPAEVLAMTPEEQAALRERDREGLENLLRKASREEEAHRSEPNVAKSLDSVLAALAVRPPADTIAESDEDTAIDDIPRRALQAAAAGAGGQGTAALVSAMAGAISEQQKAEIRQAVYDAAVSMVREAAREMIQEASSSRGASSSNSNSNSNSKARAGSVGRGGGFGNGGNEGAYQAAANAILNVMARNNNDQPAMRSAVMEGVEDRAGKAATAVAASRATESQGRAIDTGRGKSLLEAARAAARQSASAGRPPAGYDPYPPHRRRLRGLKDATFRVPVPFTRDPASNASNPKLVYNASDAIFINLSARKDKDGALQVTAQSMQGDDNNGDARQIPWPRIGGIGPALNGLGSNSNSGADPEGKGHNKHAWADALLELVHKHQAAKHPSSAAVEPHASRLLEEAAAPPQPQQAQQAPANAPEAAAPAPEPAKQPTTVGDFLQNINTKAGAGGGISAAAADGGSSGGGGGGGGGGLDLNALAGILQRPFVPPVPGAMGTKPGEMQQQQPGTVDAFGNTIDEPQPAQQQGQAPTSMMGEQEQEQEDYEEQEEDEGDSFEPMGLGDAFYDRAASQLLSHSGSNFKKMQAVVQGIMADEGFDV